MTDNLRCESGACVRLRRKDDQVEVWSTQANFLTTYFDKDEWDQFIAEVRDGQHDWDSIEVIA